ncbi:lactonase family protein [Actinomadura hibisca]|uniref:lactonase family protein n=1 Tax=Actinomadura hibisca TaxID=68565 RepID=UPI000833EF42|nr:lactonase family protein [Actinomadura hibisca]
MTERDFWVGTYGPGIYRMRRGADGVLGAPELAVEATRASYLAEHPDAPILYAVGEEPEGSLLTFAVERGGRLRPLDSRPVPADPCHLAVRPDGGTLLAACYTAGAVAAQALDGDGGFVGDPTILSGSGSGPNAERQEGPHAHCTLWAPDGTALSTDLGADLIRAYRLEGDTPRQVAEIPVPAGYGPRHLALHPSGHLYLITELEPRLLVLTPGDSYADLTVTGESAALADTSATGGEKLGAAIKIGDGGGFVYTSVRGADAVTAHRVLDGGAALEPVADVDCGGHWPRDLHVDGPWLHVANERSEDVTSFRLDARTGVPAQNGQPVSVPTPVCLIAARD